MKVIHLASDYNSTIPICRYNSGIAKRQRLATTMDKQAVTCKRCNAIMQENENEV